MSATCEYGFKPGSKYSRGHLRSSQSNLFVNGLYHQRHHEHDFRVKNVHISYHMHHRIIDTKARSKRKAFHPVHYKAVSVMDRKNAQHSCTWFCGIIYIYYVVKKIFLGQHDAFTLTCCTGGKDNSTYSVFKRHIIATYQSTL